MNINIFQKLNNNCKIWNERYKASDIFNPFTANSKRNYGNYLCST